MRILFLLLLMLLDLLPIVAFAVVAYLMLGLLHPTANLRLFAIAWINAAVIVHVVTALIRFFFAPQHPRLRMLPADNRTALYALNWGRCLSVTAVYGYFALQAGFMLGLPLYLYETLLRFLGLFVSVMLIVLILQNRGRVTYYIRGKQAVEAYKLHPRYFLWQLASFWYLAAVIYVLMLYGIWALALTNGFIFILKGTLLTVLVLIIGNGIIRFMEQSLL